jgi:hypothetical protein
VTAVLWTFPAGPLLALLAASFLLRGYNLLYNAAFFDEALYIVLGQSVLQGTWQELAPFTWVGGMPLLYPLFASLFYSVGGLWGVRFLSVVLGTAAVYLLYLFARDAKFFAHEKQNQTAALFAAGFFSILAIPMHLSRLAIYDMISFTFLLYGLVLFQKALGLVNPAEWEREKTYFRAGLLLFLSFLAKYIVVILFPFISIWGFLYLMKGGMPRILQLAKYFVVPLALASIIYVIFNFQALLVFQENQLSDGEDASAQAILALFVQYAGWPFAIGCVGAVLLGLQKKFFQPAMLLSGAVVAPIIHVAIQNERTAGQHVFLSLLFLAPLVGYTAYMVWKWGSIEGRVLLICAFAVASFHSFGQQQELEQSWQDTRGIMEYVQEHTSRSSVLLTSEGDIPKLALPEAMRQHIFATHYFEYNGTDGIEAFRSAFEDEYFDMVLLNIENPDIPVQTIIQEFLVLPYEKTYEDYPFVVYKKVQPIVP